MLHAGKDDECNKETQLPSWGALQRRAGASGVQVRRAGQGQGTPAPVYLPVAPTTTQWPPRAFPAAGSERWCEAGVGLGPGVPPAVPSASSHWAGQVSP